MTESWIFCYISFVLQGSIGHDHQPQIIMLTKVGEIHHLGVGEKFLGLVKWRWL